MKKFSFALMAIVLINISSITFAQDNILYNNDDVNTLKNILHETQNNTAILDWDMDKPGTITETEWIKINDEYYLSTLDFSSLSIDGDINLSNCLYLEECNFSNTNINSVQLPCSLKEISNNAFENCSNLQVVTVNSDNTKIGSNAFSGCILLKSIVNAEKISSIGRNAFNNCKNINFYCSETNLNSYLEGYVQQYNFDIINSVSANVYGYVGIMNHYNKTRFNLNELPLPYTPGTVSLYTLDKQFLKTVDIDENGKFSLDNLTIGTKYRIVIDGGTAIPREEYIIPLTPDYCAASKTECFGMMICDYNRDGIVNRNDAHEFSKALNHDPKDENFDFTIYDFNCDGRCNAADTSSFSVLLYIDYHNFNYE